MKKILSVLFILVCLIGLSSAIFNENVGVKDSADASVDRPLINHIKAFTNNYVPPVYNLFFATDKNSGSDEK